MTRRKTQCSLERIITVWIGKVLITAYRFTLSHTTLLSETKSHSSFVPHWANRKSQLRLCEVLRSRFWLVRMGMINFAPCSAAANHSFQYIIILNQMRKPHTYTYTYTYINRKWKTGELELRCVRVNVRESTGEVEFRWVGVKVS